jgi:hypothetical protein
MEDPQSLFEPDGAFLNPTAAAAGPWRPDALHGGAVSALLSHALAEDGWVLARVTIDLMRRVPLELLRIVPGPVSTTRRLLRKSVELWADSRMVAKGEALLLPQVDIDLPHQTDRCIRPPEDLDQQPSPESRIAISKRVGHTSFVSHAVSMRTQRRSVSHSDTFVYWLKLLLPVVAGQDITPLQRVTAGADYANGGFSTLSFEEWSFVSLDLTVQLIRPARGEWIAVTNDSLAANTGIGLGDAELYDVNGRIGRATATLLVERR